MTKPRTNERAFWSAPALWRFAEGGGAAVGFASFVEVASFPPRRSASAKAPEGWRTPKAVALTTTLFK